jgi:hypothetical protein
VRIEQGGPHPAENFIGSYYWLGAIGRLLGGRGDRFRGVKLSPSSRGLLDTSTV